MIGNYSQWLIRVVTMMALVRLLMPEHFGLVATAYLVVDLLAMLKESGFAVPIIQGQNITDQYLSTAFFANILVNLILFLAILVSAPFIARFFHSSELLLILRVISFKFIINATDDIHHILLTKNLNFKKAIIPGLGQTIFTGCIGITLAFLKCGVWSLIWALLLGSAVSSILTWKVSPWRPKQCFDLQELKTTYHFSIHVIGKKIASYLQEKIGYMVIAKQLGQTALGYFSIAYVVSIHILVRITRLIIGKVLLPTMSKLDGDEMRKEYYLKIVMYSALINFPIYFFIIASAEEIVKLICGENWIPIIMPLKTLCILGILSFGTEMTQPVFYSKRKSGLLLKLNIVYALSTAIAVLLGKAYGLAGIALALTVNGVIILPVTIFIAHSLINVKWNEYFRRIYPFFMASIIMSLFLFLISLPLNQNIVNLIIKAIGAAGMYYIALKTMGIDVRQEAKKVYRIIVN